MKISQAVVAILVLLGGSMATFVHAGDSDPLFVNITTDESHRANMAITFGMRQMERGHPLTIFLNDKGVFLGSNAHASRYADQQKTLTQLMSKGATIIACAMCMEHYGVKATDLLPGIKLGDPQLTGEALFKDNTKTLTW
jgi:sulfur relay (sulfurtransferase) complex TusBCD TusD component (DsrE family)